MSQPITHIERLNENATNLVHHMLCGESCIVLGDHIVPSGFDFYSYAHGHKATCKACRDAFKTTTNTKAMATA